MVEDISLRVVELALVLAVVPYQLIVLRPFALRNQRLVSRISRFGRVHLRH